MFIEILHCCTHSLSNDFSPVAQSQLKRASAYAGHQSPCLPPQACRCGFLSDRACLTDSFFVARLDHLAPHWIAFLNQLCEDITICVILDDDFALVRCAIRVCVLHSTDPGKRT